uniref:Homing endonuclease n=1 Tax=Siphoviridae sp. ctnPP24 TaxID=2825662 RepID=A0A8S5TYN4_9CAUD|nr:MAG TPA: homing endonuclease [Siphoviridae sp. ctnPP24]
MNELGNSQPNLESKFLKENDSYLLYSDGRILNVKTNKFLKGKIDNVGYHTYVLQIPDELSVTRNKKNKNVYAHRLVAQYFLPNPDNFPYVHHKDENKLNNNVDNLEWVSAKQNVVYHREKNGKQERRCPKYHVEDLKGEQWMVFPENELYSVSNMGRVKNNKTNRLLHLDNTHKYVRVNLNTKKHYSLNRMVYCTFNNDFDMEGYVIDHIDNNPKNNELSNLQKITFSENNLRQDRFND